MINDRKWMLLVSDFYTDILFCGVSGALKEKPVFLLYNYSYAVTRNAQYSAEIAASPNSAD